MQRTDIIEKEPPNISRYLTAMHERPAYKRAMERVGKNNDCWMRNYQKRTVSLSLTYDKINSFFTIIL
jgi:hypothetical protein